MSALSAIEKGVLALYGQEHGNAILGLANEWEPIDRARLYLACIKDYKAKKAGLDTRSLDEFVTFRYQPVGCQEFLTSPDYLDKESELYPKVIETLVEMNSGKYVEIVLTGGIGSAKTTSALYTQAYQLYLLSCYRNPHSVFKLDRASEILFIFQSITARLAMGVDYQRFRASLDTSPYFRDNFPYIQGLKSKLVFPNRIEVVPVSGSETAAIGQNVIGGVIDELNYMAVVDQSKSSVDGGTYDQAVAVYNSISRRRKSRFQMQGALPGILCLVSSKRYPGQFTDIKQEEAKTDPTIYVYDKRVWDVKPPGTFSTETFPVFIGDEHRKPRMLEPDEAVDEADKHLVDNIPMDFKGDFNRDILNALREIAGRSTVAHSPFFTDPAKIWGAMGAFPSIFSRDDVDFVATQLKILTTRFYKPEVPRFAHVDLGLTNDSAGIAIGCVPEFVTLHRFQGEEGEVVERLPKVHIDGVLEVRPPKGGEILFEKIRNIFYVLRKLGLNMRWVTYDTYQSIDSVQILRQKGFITGNESMDTTMLPYDVLKSALYDGRVEMPLHTLCGKELVQLEKDMKKGKIDHPPDGSKDCADALAGVVYGLTMQRYNWIAHKVPLIEIPNSVRNVLEKKEQKDVKSRPTREITIGAQSPFG